jgi:hypothetical protein
MKTLIKLDCDPALGDYASCAFEGELLAEYPAWAVYRRADEKIVYFDKAARSVRVLDRADDLGGYLNAAALAAVRQALSQVPVNLGPGYTRL